MRRWLVNRVTITFGVLALVIGGWNAYVMANDDGILAGRIVDRDGRPVAGAEVVLSEMTIVAMHPLVKTASDAEGRFQFANHGRHKVVVTAAKQGVGKSDRLLVRLLFRNQNTALAEPLWLDQD
jgi:hypothetical protein